MKLINPKIVASNISEIMKDYSSKKIKIHSIFNKVINIEVGKRLICIGYSEVNISPFGVVIEESDFKYLVNTINMDTVVDLKNNNITFDKKAVLSSTCDIKPHPLYFDINLIDSNRLRKNIKFLKNLVLISNWKCGFEWEFGPMINSIEGITDLKEFNNKINCVLSIKHISEESTKKFLDYFIGRGKGLTPSGDDLIIGMFAVYYFAGINIEVFKNVLEKFIDEDPSKTTKISNEYLFYSLKNQFSTSLEDLSISLLYGDEKEILKNVMNVRKAGSTSPIDTIIGIIIAIYSLMED